MRHVSGLRDTTCAQSADLPSGHMLRGNTPINWNLFSALSEDEKAHTSPTRTAISTRGTDEP